MLGGGLLGLGRLLVLMFLLLLLVWFVRVWWFRGCLRMMVALLEDLMASCWVILEVGKPFLL